MIGDSRASRTEQRTFPSHVQAQSWLDTLAGQLCSYARWQDAQGCHVEARYK